jgi:uncharacterized protein YndB with AHSA1/START domain
MSTYRFSVDIAASPDQVFDLWTDLDRMKEWVGGVTKVTNVSGPLDRAGTTYTVWFGGMKSPTTVLEAERPRRIRTRFGNRVLRGETEVSIEPSGGGTRLTQEFRTEGVIPALMARIFATGSYRGSFRGELAAFAKLVELDAVTPTS